ncbi:MAG: WD40/YVTN/BNR-like repeat-containing protein [Hyphomicrobiaceae bacterium]
MPQKIVVLVGTKKGVFILASEDGRASWTQSGPFCEAWPMNHAIADPDTGVIYAGGGNEWFGAAVWKSEDLGKTWTHSSEGLKYPEGQDPVVSVWSLAPGDGRLYAGVEPAGLFVSDDAGVTWEHVEGLTNHPTRPDWGPGGGGLILHSIVRHPGDGQKMWVGVSVAGVFYTEDGGVTWHHRNRGTRQDYLPEGQRHPEWGQCVHSIVMAPGTGNRLYQQGHSGMYRSDDGGAVWESIENGLPSTFGFPSAVHPRDPDTLYLMPLNGDSIGRFMPDGKTAVWRTRDGGESWQDLRTGLPQDNAFFGVLRQAMATDTLEPAGVYFGTGSGSLFVSADEGDSWSEVARHLPTILSVETLVADG